MAVLAESDAAKWVSRAGDRVYGAGDVFVEAGDAGGVYGSGDSVV